MRSLNGKFRKRASVSMRKKVPEITVPERVPERDRVLYTPVRVRNENREAEERREYVKLEKEVGNIEHVVLPRIQEEIDYVDQKMAEPPPIPSEEELKGRLKKALGYFVGFAVTALSALLLMVHALRATFYQWKVWERFVLAFGFVLAPVIAFHLLTRLLQREEDGRPRFSMWFLALFAVVVVLNMCVWMWVRAEYEPAHTGVNSGQITASQSQASRQSIDEAMSFGHAIVGIALDSAAAVTGCFALCLFFFNEPKLKLYRWLERLKDHRDRLRSRLVELVIDMRELGAGGNNERYFRGDDHG